MLNVTVPAGSMASFNTTISAVQALGYTNAARKYLMWTDTFGKGICGVALRYTSDADGQSNPNNGYYPQYSRIDSPCWGFGNGSNEHSVEAHELMHNLGAVSSAAPHGTRAGHCWDEYDSMCYADGGGFAMQMVCPKHQGLPLRLQLRRLLLHLPRPGLVARHALELGRLAVPGGRRQRERRR